MVLYIEKSRDLQLGHVFCTEEQKSVITGYTTINQIDCRFVCEIVLYSVSMFKCVGASRLLVSAVLR